MSPTGLSPSQIHRAYNLPSSGGNGTIAIIDAFDCPTIQNDFEVFSRQYGLPTNNLEIHKMAQNIQTDFGWSQEIALDVEWAHAIAPNATILLVEAIDDYSDSLLSAVSYASNRADVIAISMSWGSPEKASDTLLNSYFSSPGKVFFAASGDDGSGVMWPANSPNVVAVGGTSLIFNLDGSVASETGWEGSGGGISGYQPEPEYQSSYGLINDADMREVPDVSYNGAPDSAIAVYCSTANEHGTTGWFQVYGTSAGAPQWAAIYSLGFSASNNNLYRCANSYGLFFRDIVSGSNGRYMASTGYDLVTGLGSPLTFNFSLSNTSFTINTPGMNNATDVIHYFLNGTQKTGSIVGNTFSDFADIGSSVKVDNPIYLSTTQRCNTNDPSIFTIQSNGNFTVQFGTQYYIGVDTSHRSIGVSQWVTQGENFTVLVTSPTEIIPNDHQWVCSGYTVDSVLPLQGTDYTFINVQAAHNISFYWKEQLWIQVNSVHGSPNSGWAYAGDNYTASVLSPTDIVQGSQQWVCKGFSINNGQVQEGASYTFVNVQKAQRIDFNWKQQFYLSLNSMVGATLGSGWYDVDAVATTSVNSATVSGGEGIQYLFSGWSGDGSGNSMLSNSIIMNSPKSVTANWRTQFYLNIVSPYGISSGSGWYDPGSTTTATIVTSTNDYLKGVRNIFAGWVRDTSGNTTTSSSVIMNGPKTVEATWKTQYYIEINSNIGVTYGSGWYEAGSLMTFFAETPTAIEGERYLWHGWNGTGKNSYTGNQSSLTIEINGTIIETASWVHQYLLTVTTPYGKPTPESGWYNADQPIVSSVISTADDNFLIKVTRIGWEGTGNIPLSGRGDTIQFTINQPSSITWKWQTLYNMPTIIGLALVALSMTFLTILILFLRRGSYTYRIH